MEKLGLALVVGATLSKQVSQAFGSVAKQAAGVQSKIEKLQVGKTWADNLLSIEKKIKANENLMSKLGRTTAGIKTNERLKSDLASASIEAQKFGINLSNASDKSKQLSSEIAKIKNAAAKADMMSAAKDNFKQAAFGLAGLTGGFMVVKGAIDKITGPAASFEKGMAMVSTLVDTNSVRMDQLSGTARNLSKEFGLSTSSMTEGMYQAISAGVDAQKVGGFMKVAGQMAVGGGVDIKTATDGMSSAVNAYGEATLSAQQASDIMFMTVNRGKTTVGELSHNLAQVTPIASNMGVKFTDVSAALATLTYTGVPTAQATTQVRGALVELSKDSTNVSKAFKNMTGKSFKDYIAQGGNLKDAFDIIKEAAKKQGKELTDLFGSIEGAQAVMALTGAASKRFGEDMQVMSKSVGASETAFDKMAKTASFRSEQAAVKFEDLKISLGSTLLPVVSAAADIFGGIADSINYMVNVAPEGTEAILAIAGGFALVIGAAKGIAIVKAAVVGLNLAISANPIMLVAGLMVAAGIMIYKNWDEIVSGIKLIWGQLSSFFSSVWDGVKSVFSAGFEFVKGLFFKYHPIGIIISQWTEITGFISNINLFESGAKIIDTMISGIVSSKNKLFDVVSGAFEKVRNLLPFSDAKEGPFKDLTLSGSKIITTLAEGADSSKNSLKNSVSGSFSNAAAPTQPGLNANAAPAGKSITITIQNFTVQAASIDESLPKIIEKVKAALKQAATEEMGDSYATSFAF